VRSAHDSRHLINGAWNAPCPPALVLSLSRRQNNPVFILFEEDKMKDLLKRLIVDSQKRFRIVCLPLPLIHRQHFRRIILPCINIKRRFHGQTGFSVFAAFDEDHAGAFAGEGVDAAQPFRFEALFAHGGQ